MIVECKMCGCDVEAKRKSKKYCKDCAVERDHMSGKKYREKNPHVKEEYRSNNREKILKQMRDYSSKNKERLLKNQKEYQKKRLTEDPLFRLLHQMRCLIGGSLKRKGYKKNSKTEQILGCSIPEFHKYIESLFKEGMSWDNRSEWEIDHVIPVASAKTEEELLKLNHFTNLQPLWTEENRKKGSKLLYL